MVVLAPGNLAFAAAAPKPMPAGPAFSSAVKVSAAAAAASSPAVWKQPGEAAPAAFSSEVVALVVPAVAAGALGAARRRRVLGRGSRAAAVRAPQRALSTVGMGPSACLFDFTVQDIDGNDVNLAEFEGRVTVIVNVASKCGLTKSNYSELCELYKKYRSRGFEVLAFPCNQFKEQEPGTSAEIKEFAQSKCPEQPLRMFAKIHVNGDAEEPLYTFLKGEKGAVSPGDDIEWNFTKFLVNRNGEVVHRIGPKDLCFEDKIEALL